MKLPSMIGRLSALIWTRRPPSARTIIYLACQKLLGQ